MPQRKPHGVAKMIISDKNQALIRYVGIAVFLCATWSLLAGAINLPHLQASKRRRHPLLVLAQQLGAAVGEAEGLAGRIVATPSGTASQIAGTACSTRDSS